MSYKKKHEYEQEFRLINDRLTRIEDTPAPSPVVNNWLTAIVSTSPESLDAVLYAAAGMVVGLPASAATVALGGDGANAVQVWGVTTAAGVGLGVVRLAVGAVDLTGALEMLADKWLAYKDRQRELEPVQGSSTRDLPIHSSRGTTVTTLETTPTIDPSKEIKSCNTASGWRTVKTSQLWDYLQHITYTKRRTKDARPDDYINQKEWPDVRDYLIEKGWWNLPPNSPTLQIAEAHFWGTVTNGTERNGTNGGTE